MTHDRRRSERSPLATFAALATGDTSPNDQAFSVAVDVSRSGIGVRTGQPPAVGQTVVLRLAFGESIHTLTATAMRVEERARNHFDVGLDWAGCTEEQLRCLDAYLAAVAGSPAS